MENTPLQNILRSNAEQEALKKPKTKLYKKQYRIVLLDAWADTHYQSEHKMVSDWFDENELDKKKEELKNKYPCEANFKNRAILQTRYIVVEERRL